MTSLGVKSGWSSRIDYPIVTHILRDRSARIPYILRFQYAELQGIKRLRSALRRCWTQKELRQKRLVLTASTQLLGSSGTIIEFDGALLRISTRSGPCFRRNPALTAFATVCGVFADNPAGRRIAGDRLDARAHFMPL
jgi:hypothetical protein